jgi:hypothetical protein
VSAAPSNLARLYRGIEALYGIDTGIDPHDVLLPFDAEVGTNEMLLLREADDGALEVGLMIDEHVLRCVQDADADAVLGDDALAHALPVIEGLSHLAYVAEAARRDKPVSGLVLEAQAEVDKLAICLLDRWGDARRELPRLVDRLFYRFELVPMSGDLRERYETANRLALGFSRRLRPHVEGGQLGELRGELRRFWHGSLADKLALAA